MLQTQFDRNRLMVAEGQARNITFSLALDPVDYVRMMVAQAAVTGHVDQSALAGAGDQFEQNVIDSLDVLGLLRRVRVERMTTRYEVLGKKKKPN